MMQRWLAVPASCVVLAACQGGHAPQAASTPLAAQHTQYREASLYTIEARLPRLDPDWAPLRQALEAYVADKKAAFLAGLKLQPARDQARQMPWDLDLETEVVGQAGRLVSVKVQGSSFTGGAHPTPILDTFTYDTQARKIVSLDDLFTDAPAVELALAAEARRQLLTRLDDNMPLVSSADAVNDGTQPGQHHFDTFTLSPGQDGRAANLTLLFPPYQVAAYVAGTQAVDVPVGVFAPWLKPDYRTSFTAP
jgi:uncharacterized protein DUF3298